MTFDLPDTLSLFPLSGALLLPRSRLPLHLFEPRYLAMFDDCLKTKERLIGMVQPFATERVPDGLHMIGCAGRVTAFSETDDGRYMITLTGVSRFRIRQEVQGFTPYRRAEVSWGDFERDRGVAEADEALDKEPFLKLIGRYFAANELEADWESLKEADSELLINSLSMLCPFEAEEKQALLEAPRLVNRRETLVTLMEMAIRGPADGDLMQ